VAAWHAYVGEHVGVKAKEQVRHGKVTAAYLDMLVRHNLMADNLSQPQRLRSNGH
jgi:hypothetical protein